MRRSDLQYALFDLDNTLYAKSSGVMQGISRRIDEYMAIRLGMGEALLKRLRRRYREEYGTTMRGLLVEHGVDTDDYLAYVHDLPIQDLLAPNVALDQALGELPWRKVIFTSATREHADRVLAALDVEAHFEGVFGIRDTGYVCKPNAVAYHSVCDALDVGADECIMVEDSLPNLQAAKKLGMLTILVGCADGVDGADFVIRRIEAIADIAHWVAGGAADQG
jgi:putative hydrolase of the HAD superfamily